MVGRPTIHCCSFCRVELSAVELLFYSTVGGLPPSICSSCVEGFNDVLTLHRADPAAAAKAVAAHNAAIEKGKSQ